MRKAMRGSEAAAPEGEGGVGVNGSGIPSGSGGGSGIPSGSGGGSSIPEQQQQQTQMGHSSALQRKLEGLPAMVQAVLSNDSAVQLEALHLYQGMHHREFEVDLESQRATASVDPTNLILHLWLHQWRPAGCSLSFSN